MGPVACFAEICNLQALDIQTSDNWTIKLLNIL